MDMGRTFQGFARTLYGVVKATFGPGALGRLGTVAIAAMVVLCVLGLALTFVEPLFGLVALGVIFTLAIIFILRGFAYADRYPQFAAMDGAQITRIMTRDVGVKPLPGAPVVQMEAPLIENPKLVEQPEADRV